jgi:hypothetical protein
MTFESYLHVVINVEEEALLAKIHSDVLAHFLHSHHRIQPPLVDVPTSHAQEVAIPGKECRVVSEVHSASNRIIGVEFGPIGFPSSLAAEYISVVAMVSPRFQLPSGQFIERDLLRTEPNAY